MFDLENGEVASAGTFRVAVRPFPTVPLDLRATPDVAIALTTFNPPHKLFEAQVESIRKQTYPSWVCIVCDDGSTRASRARIRQTLRNDPRFVFVENRERQGFYLNFERAVALVPPDVRYVAFADQDDRWHPHKLERLVDRLERDELMELVASDARLVDVDGRLLSESFYRYRVPTHDDPYSLFLVNSLIGASMLFRRRLLDIALPFPRAFDNVYHDHWLARVALSMGRVGFQDEPLYDYVQHGDNVLGSRAAQRWPMRALIAPYLRSAVRGDDRLPEDWAAHFMTNIIEPQLAADLITARWPNSSNLPWLRRISAGSSIREILRIMLDHRRDTRARRTRRENVGLVLFAGRVWARQHRPVSR